MMTLAYPVAPESPLQEWDEDLNNGPYAQEFWEYHRLTPRLWAALEAQVAERVGEPGMHRVSINDEFRALRKTDAALYLNVQQVPFIDAFRAYYSRLLMLERPEWVGRIEVRQMKYRKGLAE
jgi:hypothetical protein